ncbi:Precorrin-6A reductase [Phycicoccus elongatus Lp2]|uniref:Precorrin-6A reductase n=1 Tax=Phycicoccus elongatus Lp2 TaxID=1193181 RepID=N0E6F5_9MICO|nr:precorrin-6A/cobalt-precorrin-6A reductase [Phycicoccus elongatus]CCH71454.1 Precorrin-6A reductase [Phycicoccus elongatus Lp2]
MRVLVLGGTAEARALAVALHDRGVDFVSSLAGRVTRPRMPVGQVRIGGFGGVDGLADTLREGGFTHLIDATHPFATTMTAHAVAAASLAGVPALRLALPHFAGWTDRDVLVRVVEPLDGEVPPRWTVVLDRGPYCLDRELDLLRGHRIDVLVTKDSGGAYTSAKLDAAAELGVAVVVVARPPAPRDLVTIDDVAGCLSWLAATGGIGDEPRRPEPPR